MAVDQIEQEFQQLRSAYQSEPNLKTVLDGFDNMTSFSTAWNYVQGHFEHLQLFCGSMATAFPTTSMVKTDFSIVKWEKDDGRMSLSNFSLEGIMHCKQHEHIQCNFS